MMVHQGMRKKCPECGKVLSDLWKHMRTMHGQYRRRTKISKEEALENNLVPKDTKSRVNVKVLHLLPVGILKTVRYMSYDHNCAIT